MLVVVGCALFPTRFALDEWQLRVVEDWHWKLLEIHFIINDLLVIIIAYTEHTLDVLYLFIEVGDIQFFYVANGLRCYFVKERMLETSIKQACIFQHLLDEYELVSIVKQRQFCL